MKRLALVLFAWLMQAAPLAAQAQSAPTRCNPAMQCCRQVNLPGDPGCAGGGNPINLITGNKYQQEVDLAPLPGVQGIEIVRRYNSASALDSHPNRANGLLGKGWRLSYEIELGADGEHQRTLTLADGSTIGFTRGVLQPTHFIASDLGQGRLVEQGDGTEWQRLDGQRFSFNTQGRLVQIHAASGEFTSLAHDGQGRLIKVTDPQGRSLVLHYADAKSATRYRGVSAIDTPVGRFEYSYGSHAGAANLVRVALPGNVQRHYHYEDPRHASALTGISIQDDKGTEQRLSTYLYDARGLAVLSVKGRPATLQTDASGRASKPYRLQDGSGVEQVVVERGNDSVTVLNSLNQKSRAKWTELAGQRLITEFIGAGCAHCPPPNTRWAYDQQGRLSETTQLDANGRSLQSERHELDAWGRVKATYRVSYANGQAQTELIARYEYTAPLAEGASDATQPTLIARPSVVPGKEHRTRIAYNAHGQPTAITEEGFSPIDDKGEAHATPITRTTDYTYSRINGRSVLTQIDGPLANGAKNAPEDSDITTMQWDERGRVVIAITQPGGFKNEVGYDQAARLRQVRNDEGATSRYHYNVAGQLARLERSSNGAATQTQRFEYDAPGRLVEVGAGSADTYKAQTRQSWDAADRLLWRAHALGWAEQWRRDSEGRVIEEGRFSARIVQSTAYEWNDDGSLKAVSDNAERRVVLPALSVRPGPSTGSEQGTPAGLSKGRAELVSAPARTRHLADDFGRVVWTRSADSGHTIRRFDAADRLIGMSDALDNQARYDYDAAGRIAKQSSQAKARLPVVTEWRYEGRRLVQLIHPTQSERYAYDAQGRRVERSLSLGGHAALTRYERDANGELTAVTLADGSRIAHERNGQGQITALTRSRVHTDWLRRFEKPQLLAKDFERDLVGLASYTAGNGIEARFIRSREGTLARVLYRQPQPKSMTARSGAPEFIGRNTQDTFERLLGIAPAHASSTATTPVRAEPVEASGNKTIKLPGALGHPQDPQALVDHRYLWDARGNLLLDAQRAGPQPTDSGYAYDRQSRLIIASTQAANTTALQPVALKADSAQSTSYYLHDAQGRRVLAQEAQQATRRIAYEERTHRWTNDADIRAEYDASGLPKTIGNRTFEWDAHGRLMQVREGDKTVAQYHYNHRGQRIDKQTASEQVQYLYDEQGQLAAELDKQGRIKRQYVYAANLPIAVIDGDAALHHDTAAWLQAFKDISHIVRSWIGSHNNNTTWLHTNHLGAPEAATDGSGQFIWQASYSASGRARTTVTAFTLHLRLPGQYEDAETGLHYNQQRYYNPERGQYLSPDPLASSPGYPDGPNPYAYVRYNPLRYVDPQGLILFAFDGTGNTNDANDLQALGSSESNVRQFWQLYQDGGRRYVTGVGTRHRDEQYGDIENAWYLGGNSADMGTNLTGRARIARMMQYFDDEADTAIDDDAAMIVDIIGFSRGAAQARDFANRIVANTRDGYYRYTRNENGRDVTHCQRVQFRFMGLWDTVLSTSVSSYNMRISDEFAYVAQAIALNEHRGQSTRRLPGSRLGAFPLESIHDAPGADESIAGRTRIERGFIGAHADIGGGFGPDQNQLARVAMAWMVQQAVAAGVNVGPMANSTIEANPVIHDKSDNQFCLDGVRCPAGEDRQVRYVGGTRTTQREMNPSAGMRWSDTQSNDPRFINYLPETVNGRRDLRPDHVTGSVNMREYLLWLRDNGYDLGSLQAQ